MAQCSRIAVPGSSFISFHFTSSSSSSSMHVICVLLYKAPQSSAASFYFLINFLFYHNSGGWPNLLLLVYKACNFKHFFAFCSRFLLYFTFFACSCIALAFGYSHNLQHMNSIDFSLKFYWERVFLIRSWWIHKLLLPDP
jgi:hypothetical protein